MNWYLNRALTGFRVAVNARYPHRDKTSDGTIADAAHQATDSDHNEDADGSVDAWDMDVDLGTGNNHAEIERLKTVFESHESSRYWIHDGQIASRSNGWRRLPYYGSNRHDKHVHWNTRETHEDSTKPWIIGGNVTLDSDDGVLVSRAVHNQQLFADTVTVNGQVIPLTIGRAIRASYRNSEQITVVVNQLAAIAVRLDRIEAAVNTLSTGGVSQDVIETAVKNAVRAIVNGE